MGLNRLGINNADKYKNPITLKVGAQQNYREFTRINDLFIKNSSNDKMLTNIQYMRVKLDDMIASGRIINDEFEHNLLESALQQAVNLQLKSKRSMDDIVNFYYAYNNFEDISNKLGGGN